jgi:NADH-quinone oxidoreductase subunit J
MGNVVVWIIWVIAATACVLTAARVVTAVNPFSSALSLIGNLASLAVLYLLASGEFVAAAQVLVYAGAVMVMFLFVLAYLGGRADAPFAGEHRGFQAASIGASAALLAVTLVALAMDATEGLSDEAMIGRGFGSPQAMGRLFLTDHLLAFEITSIVLLVAAVGGVILGTKASAEDEADADAEAAAEAGGASPTPTGGVA